MHGTTQCWRRQIGRRPWIPALLALTMAMPLAHAEVDFGLSRRVESAYVSGETLDIEVTLALSTDETPTVLGLEETLPAGWSFEALVGGQTPSVSPAQGRTGLLDEFAWIPAPAFPVTFTYRVRAGADSEGDRVLSGQGVLRTLETGEHRTSATTTVLPWAGAGPFHSADTNATGAVELSEMLRVVQLYHADAYGCATGTEDGYTPGADGEQTCEPHDADYLPQDWTLSLREVLRVVQMFNGPGIHYCPDGGTEDGYCLTAE